MRKIYLYKKYTEDGNAVKEIAEELMHSADKLYVVTEHSRESTKFDEAVNQCSRGDVLIIENLTDLGQETGEAIARLDKVIASGICLVSSDVKATFMYGVSPDTNIIALQSIREMLLKAVNNGDRQYVFPTIVGRPEVNFPDGWDEKYNEWKNKKISSSDFLKWSGLKKATFYNKVTQYREILESEKKYIESIRTSEWAKNYMA